MYQYDNDNPVRPAWNHADKNLALRSYGLVSATKAFVDYGSDDPVQPPQLATLFNPSRVPVFSNTYNANNWNWQASPNPGTQGGPISAPWPVTVLGLQTTPGEVLRAPTHSRDIGADFGTGGSMVIYADADSLTLKFTREDSAATGYTVHIDNICTDPNLLALYNSLDNAARNTYSASRPYSYNLPGLTSGKTIGTARGAEIRIAIVDSGSFMDPRSRNEWWQIAPTPTCYTLTTAISPAGGGTVTPESQNCLSGYASGTVVQVTASPAASFTFSNWSGAAGGSANPITITMDGNKTLTGNFVATTTFADVPATHWAYAYIEALYDAGYTAGCNTSPLMYCPENTMNRAESAVFVVRGVHGATYSPTDPTVRRFDDVLLAQWYTKWVEQLAADNYTAGCSSNPPLYCPMQGHTRAEGSVFYLRMLNGPTYSPPEPTVQLFSDVPLGQWYTKWAHAAYNADLIEPCQTSPSLRFCPAGPLTRALAAYMMVKAKNLPLP